MSAGLPGVGLSGVFFICSALLMVPLEIGRTIRGRSSRERWSRVLRHLAIALAMILCLELAYAAVRLLVEQLRTPLSHAGGAARTDAAKPSVHVLPIAPVAATLGAIALLLLLAKAAQLLARWRTSRSLAPEFAIISGCSATSSLRCSPARPRASASSVLSEEA